MLVVPNVFSVVDIGDFFSQVADLEPCVQSLGCPLQGVSVLLKLCWPLHPPFNQQIKQLPSAFLHIMGLAEILAVRETQHKLADVRVSW